MTDKEIIEYSIGLQKFSEIKTTTKNKDSIKKLKSIIKNNKHKKFQGTDRAFINLCSILKIIGINFDFDKIQKLDNQTIIKLKEIIEHYLQEKKV